MIKIAEATDFEKLIPAFLELRTHRNAEFIREMLPILYKENYRVAYIGDENTAFSLLGFHTIHTLFSGKTLYIDDLSTLEAYRKHGYGGQLMDWIKDYAKQNDYDHLSLDSGPIRRDAHRLYLNKGLYIESMHFARVVNEL